MRPRLVLALALGSSAWIPFAGCVGDTPPVVGTLYDASHPEDASSPEASTMVDATVGDAAPDSPVTSEDAGAPDASPPVDAAPLDATTTVDAAVNDAGDAGPSGLALLFDGVQDRVELPAADGGANETAFSVEIWFKTTNATGSLFEVYGGGGADRFLVVEGGNVCFYVYGTPIELLCSPLATYDDGVWHYAAGTLGSNNGTCLYIDGVLSNSATTPTSSNFNYDTNFRLGYGHTTLNSALVYFGGELDEVRVWSVERAAGDIEANYDRSIDPATPGLQGYWKLDGTGADTTATDSTAYGHDGTLVGFSFAPSPWVTGGAPLVEEDGG